MHKHVKGAMMVMCKWHHSSPPPPPPPPIRYTNTTDNDLQYWGLDYPPLTAYHSRLCGSVAHWINPDWVALRQSRGYESYDHKLFMRYSVLAVDVLVYFTAVIAYCRLMYRSREALWERVRTYIGHASDYFCTHTHIHMQTHALEIKCEKLILQCKCPQNQYTHASSLPPPPLSVSLSLSPLPPPPLLSLSPHPLSHPPPPPPPPMQTSLLVLLLLQPAVILIDHGHFQYNCVSLGLAFWAVIAVTTNHDIIGSVLFTLALNYKQMEFYHTMPFFCYLLGKIFESSSSRGRQTKRVALLGLTVICTFVVCWFPFLGDWNQTRQVWRRLFPFSRGLYEDKVANIWCSLAVVVKLKQLLSLSSLVKVTAVSTMTAVVPSSWNLLRNPTPHRFIMALVYTHVLLDSSVYTLHVLAFSTCVCACA